MTEMSQTVTNTTSQQVTKHTAYVSVLTASTWAKFFRQSIGNKVPDLENKVPDLENKVPDIENKVPELANKVPELENKVPGKVVDDVHCPKFLD